LQIEHWSTQSEYERTLPVMSSKSPAGPQSPNPPQPCKHPRVQIVGRDEDAEFVECTECGEVFEASEFKDMTIEESGKDDA
jgi:hypothetical protein